MNVEQDLRLRRKFVLFPHTHPSHHPPNPPPHAHSLPSVFTWVKMLEQKLEQGSPETWVLLQVEAAWILAPFLFPFSLQATPGTLTLPLSWGPVWTEAGNPSRVSPPPTPIQGWGCQHSWGLFVTTDLHCSSRARGIVL